MKLVLITLIKIYQLCLSPLIGANCRFKVSCSNYALQSLEKHGVLKGSWLAVKRIVRCNPWCDCTDEE